MKISFFSIINFSFYIFKTFGLQNDSIALKVEAVIFFFGAEF
jgi:hypothetical protein